jgi:DNA polymerase-3 subunit delta'
MSLLDVKGQQRAIAIIRKFIEQNNINSSFLFFGNKGTGKHLTALNMAKALNCTGQRTEVWLSDDTCESCKKIQDNIHPDVMQLSVPMPDDNSQMDTIVQTIEWLNMPLFEGKQKVLIVDDASELNIHAQNAMLKTLEEPPQWATIIFITSSYAKLLPTIQSRLIKIGFNRLSTDVIKEILSSMTDLDREQLEYLAVISDGGIKHISITAIKNEIKNIISSLAGLENTRSIVNLAERFKSPSYKEHFNELVDVILPFLIDAVIIDYNQELIRNKEFLEEIKYFSTKFKKGDIINTAIALEQARAAYELNINPQMIMEHVLFQLMGEQ